MRNRYKKGADFERQLVLDFWDNGWAAVRAAGSGTRIQPVPDIIATKKCRIIVVECKTTTKDCLSLKTAITELERYQKIGGGQAYIAVKFLREKPRFYNLKELKKKKNYTITKKEGYMTFEMILGEQAIL